MHHALVRSFVITLLVTLATLTVSAQAVAPGACSPLGYRIELSPFPNFPGPLPSGVNSPNYWYQIEPGQTKAVAITVVPCSGAFPANVDRVKFKFLSEDGWFTANAPVAGKTGPTTFSPANMNISVNAAATRNLLQEAYIEGELVDAADNPVGPNDGIQHFRLDIYTGLGATFEIAFEPAGDIQLSPGQTATRTVRITSVNGFSGTVNLTTDYDDPPLEQATLAPPSVTVPAGGSATTTLTVKARSTATVGTTAFNFVKGISGTIENSRVFNVQIVAPPATPDFTFTITQPTAPVMQGQSTPITITVSPTSGYNSPITFTLTSPGNAITATPVTINAPYAPTQMTLQVAANAPVAPATFTVSATSPSGVKTANGSVTVLAAPTPSFDLAATSPAAPLLPGRTTTVTATITPLNGFNSPVTVTVTSAGNVVTAAPVTIAAPYGPRQITLQVASSAPEGPAQYSLVATSGTLTRTSTGTITVLPQPATRPIVTAFAPASVVVPVRSQQVIVTGQNFEPGVIAIAEQPGQIVIESTRYISPTSAAITLSVRPNTQHGRGYLITMRNPNGVSSTDDSRVAVLAADDLRAPLSVTTAMIRYPNPGQTISSGKAVYAVGQLATSGTGTVTGRWRLRSVGNTNDAGYVFDQFTATVAGGFLLSSDRPCHNNENATTAQICTAVSIPTLPWNAAGYDLELVVDQPQLVEPARIRVVFQSDSATEMTVYTPAAGATVSIDPRPGAEDDASRFSWTMVPGANGYVLEFRKEGEETVRPVRITTTRPEWKPGKKDLLRIGPGAFQWRARATFPGDIQGPATAWQPVIIRATPLAETKPVAILASASAQDATLPAEQATPTSTNYALAPNVTITDGTDQDTAVRAGLSTQGELQAQPGTSKFTGDLSYSGAFDPNKLVQESRNWVINAGTSPTNRFRVDGDFGYTTPDFTSGAEYLVSATALTGITGRMYTPAGTFSYYQPVNTAIHGVMTGLTDPYDVRSAAFSTPDGKRFQLRFIGLEVEEDDNLEFGTLGSRLRTLGVFGKYDLTPNVALTAEVARGKVSSTSGETSRSGNAMRVGLMGRRGALNYTFNVRSIDPNFVNPGNRGLTVGGVADRLMLDGSVSTNLRGANLSVSLRRQDQGRASDSTLPEASQNALSLSVMRQFGRVGVNVSTNWVADDADADALSFLPRTDRSQSGINASFMETFGRLSLVQTFSFQRLEDAVNDMASSDMSSLSLTATGSISQFITISGSLNGSRNEAAPQLGTTNTFSIAVQPSFAVPKLWIAFQPSASLSRSRNGLLAMDTKSEQYNASLQWSPTWLGSLLAAQISSSWSRSESAGFESPLQQSFSVSLGLRMNKTKGMPLFPTAVLPGM